MVAKRGEFVLISFFFSQDPPGHGTENVRIGAKMTPLFKKMNLVDQDTILVLNAPDMFEAELAKLEEVAVLRKATAKTSVSFSIGFAITMKELQAVSAKLIQTAKEDATIWVAYPKGTSKRYQCEFNRDTGWTSFGEAGFEPVRQVAIDEDWSALRFRRAEYIKTMKRSSTMAISKEGKRRAQGLVE